jgi:hypothetical protein
VKRASGPCSAATGSAAIRGAASASIARQFAGIDAKSRTLAPEDRDVRLPGRSPMFIQRCQPVTSANATVARAIRTFGSRSSARLPW